MDSQIIRDHATSRSRGFGFIIFDSEQVVDDLLADSNMIDLAGAQVSREQCLPPNISADTDFGLCHFTNNTIVFFRWYTSSVSLLKFFCNMLSFHFFYSLYYHYGVNFTLWVLFTFAAEVFTDL